MPRFTIVVPAYNNAVLLTDCLDSIAAQTLSDWECIVVSDASPDNTADIVRDYASRDARFSLVEKPVNEGLHLTRATGTAQATGDYVLYLDADDELAGPDVLAALGTELSANPVDILRFGLVAEADNSTPDESAHNFAAWSNAESGPLSGMQALEGAFLENKGYRLPWHMTHRTFERTLVQRAFAAMTGERLERAEDAYEYFVVASLAETERARCDIMGYRYRMGAGVTNSDALSAERFAAEARAMRDCYAAAADYAASFEPADLALAARGLKRKLLESAANIWHERVPADQKTAAARDFARIVGAAEADCEFYRFVRDRAYAHLDARTFPAEDDELHLVTSIAREHFAGDAPAEEQIRLDAMKERAESHLLDLALRERRESYEQQPVRIFVSAHKNVDLFDSSVLQPVQVGAAQAGQRFELMYHDDEGDNISHLNPLYCELTAQYWAWKNVDAPYLGFCHYRRYFDFSATRHAENEWGEVMDDYIDEAAQRAYALDDEAIIRAVEGFDVITTEIKDLRRFPGSDNTPLKQYKAAPYLHDDDLIRSFAILEDLHPEYKQDVEEFANGNHSCFCNMFIMRKELFDAYCAWLFPILERFVETTDMSLYSHEALRTPGHLSERLFNIYYRHHLRTGANWKTKQVQCVHFTNPEPLETLRALPVSVTRGLPVVPCVFASDGNYVPMVTTTIHSMLKNASPARHYDITILSRAIAGEQQRIMREFFAQFQNASLRFYDVTRLVDSYDLTTNNAHIGAETYYRFIIQDAMPFYDKVLYLDSDLIIEGDVAELYDTDLGENLIGAVRDIDFLGNLNMKDGARLKYARQVLNMSNPYDYFQAGVLVLNTRGLRSHVPVKQWLTVATETKYIYNDQDILNEYCQGKVLYLDASWNVMNDCGGRIAKVFTFAPGPVFDEFSAARTRERVIHYAGFEKPWNTPYCDRREKYWQYAHETPFYETLLAHLFNTARPQKRIDDHESALSPTNPLRRVLDPVMPLDSRRRETAKAIARAVRGLD